MTAAEYLPESRSLTALAAAANSCQGCDLYQRATQTVFGEGSSRASVVLVGEQPGDREDIEGRPFVGPAGRLLDEALEEAELPRNDVYITNAVKHFKWEPRGTRRLHKKPSSRELNACRPWLDAELEALEPRAVVYLGATAAQQAFGRAFRITRQRGEWLNGASERLQMATWHPAAILRAPDRTARGQMRKDLISDLTKVARRLAR